MHHSLPTGGASAKGAPPASLALIASSLLHSTVDHPATSSSSCWISSSSSSSEPLSGDVLVAYAGGDVRAALSVDSGRAVADPFYPSAELVDLLHAAAGDSHSRRRFTVPRRSRAAQPSFA